MSVVEAAEEKSRLLGGMIDGFAMKRIKAKKKELKRIHPALEFGGFTLIEVMVAMTVFVIGSLAMVSLMVTVVKANRDAYGLTEAVTAGRNEMERIMALANPGNNCTTTDFWLNNTTFLAAQAASAECAREIMVQGTHFTNGVRFQVDNQRTRVSTSEAYITVFVRWPRRMLYRNLSVVRGDAEAIDCIGDASGCTVISFNNHAL